MKCRKIVLNIKTPIDDKTASLLALVVKYTAWLVVLSDYVEVTLDGEKIR
jgi:hypothetical protein